jgi:carboxypeptidase Q
MRKTIVTFLILLTPFQFIFCQSDGDPDIMSRIRNEGFNNSQVMTIAHYLTNVSGPRLTNSPGFIQASNWTIQQLNSWGLNNVHLDPWGKFGSGWTLNKCYVAMNLPYYHPLIAYPFAWSKGTNGVVKSDIVMINALDVDTINKYNYQVKGKIVIVKTRRRSITSPFSVFADRYSDSSLKNMGDEDMLTGEDVKHIKSFVHNMISAAKLLKEKGAVAIMINLSPTRDGTVEADMWWSGKKNANPDLPVVSTTPEDHLTMQRLIESHIPIQVEMDIQTKFNDKDENGYNVIAEIPGTDPSLKSQVVMLGGHLDSWFSATGATDNAAGCAVMMEAIRILKKLDIKPKRTIRIALWGGEEQGLLGSYGYVRKYFGDPETMKLLPEQNNVSAYYNLDNGTGKIRGIFLQGNKEVQSIFQKWIEPFNDLGVTTTTLSSTGATDHISFDAVGIPAFQFIQDPVEYHTRTHHTNMDSYDHLMADDLKQAAVIVAAFVYNTATRNDMLPRKPLPSHYEWIYNLFD